VPSCAVAPSKSAFGAGVFGVSETVCLSALTSSVDTSLFLLLSQALNDTPTAIIVLTIRVCRVLFHMGNLLTLLDSSENGINKQAGMPLIMNSVCY
jgi:hypothetical protein